MPILFGSLTALVLAISGWIGYKNQAEYKNQIVYKEEQKRALVFQSGELNKITSKLEETVEEKKETIAQNESLSEELTGLEAKISEIKDEIAQKKSDKKRLEAEIAAENEVLDKVGGARDLVPKIGALRSDIAGLNAQIEEGSATLSNLKQAKSDTEKSITVNERRVEYEASGKSQPDLNTTIKTVYSSWGFVTLNGGDVQGVVPGSTLNVIRGEDVVAKLKVTTVEPNRAAADILRETVGADVFLRSGDKVVAEDLANPAGVANKITAN